MEYVWKGSHSIGENVQNYLNVDCDELKVYILNSRKITKKL